MEMNAIWDIGLTAVVGFGLWWIKSQHDELQRVTIWLKEAGVQWTDTQAVKDVIKKKLISNEFQKIRVWEGNW